jgi:hypothetical protein
MIACARKYDNKNFVSTTGFQDGRTDKRVKNLTIQHDKFQEKVEKSHEYDTIIL